jgi:hypothetical protein
MNLNSKYISKPYRLDDDDDDEEDPKEKKESPEMSMLMKKLEKQFFATRAL